MQKNYNIRETAKILGITVRTIRQWIRDGKIKAVKYANCPMWFIPEDEISRIKEGK